MLTILAMCLAGPGDLTRPLDLYELTVEQARQVDGCRVEAFLEAGCPVDVGDGYMVVGGYEKDDGVSRSLILRASATTSTRATRSWSPACCGWSSTPRRP